jgi:predicted enzyme related to lactoylglutathione lyase
MPFKPENAVVWSEIPVTDLNRATTFYTKVLECEMRPDHSGTMVDIIADTVAGHLYVGQPAPRGTGITLHLAVQGTVEDALIRTKAAGGTVVTPIITIPLGRFAKIPDLDGNSIGLFQAT